ncbi:MAG TPA: PorV/PorQ family protein [Saprospiraceae bacterium]|nr:PorV/PorQ family protein [Saprospiraceae bacterium]
MIRSFAMGVLFLFIPLGLFAQAKYSNEFLQIGVGARAQAMGNAVVANIADVTAGVWNPAGLAARKDFKGIELGAMHNEWFAGVGQYDYLGFTMPFAEKKRHLALSMLRFGIDNIPNTLSLYEADGTVNFDNLTTFSAADYAFLLSYAQDIPVQSGQLSIGGNIKVIHRRIGPFATSWGFGLDLGMQYRQKNWAFGLVLRDIPSTFNGWSFAFSEEEKEVLELTNNEVPINSVEVTNPSLTLGISRKFQSGKIGIRPEVDAILTTDGPRNTLVSGETLSLDPAVGLELDYQRFVFLRFGLNQFQEVPDFSGNTRLAMRPSVGLGLQFNAVQLDYAFSDSGATDNLYSHVVSLIIQLKEGE